MFFLFPSKPSTGKYNCITHIVLMVVSFFLFPVAQYRSYSFTRYGIYYYIHRGIILYNWVNASSIGFPLIWYYSYYLYLSVGLTALWNQSVLYNEAEEAIHCWYISCNMLTCWWPMVNRRTIKLYLIIFCKYIL